MEDFTLTLGQRLRLIRQKRGLTQKAVAEMLGIRPPSLCAYEKGQSEPNVATLCWYARYFNVTADWLLGLERDGVHLESSTPTYQRTSAEPQLSDEELRRLRGLLHQD